MRPLKVTLELGVSQSTQDKLSFWDVIFLVTKLHRRVSKHDLPSQSLYKGSGKQCRLNWPASSMYPRVPKFTHETAEHSHIFFCTHAPHRYTVSLPYKPKWAFKRGHNAEIKLYACKKHKCAFRHVDKHTQKLTCTRWQMKVVGVCRQSRQMQKSKHAQELHTVFVSVWTCRLTVFGRQPLTVLRHWYWRILDTLCGIELFFFCWIKCTSYEMFLQI